MSFKKRKTTTADIPNSAASTSTGAVKVEPQQGANSSLALPTVSALPQSEAVETKPFVVSMKIGNMQGGGPKRKFRVREPSPP